MDRKLINEKLEEAIELSENSDYEMSLSVLFNLLGLLRTNQSEKYLNIIYCHIGNTFKYLKKYGCALEYFDAGLSLKPNDEYSSLGKYISLIKLDRDEEGILEMFRFLKTNDADLYKVTLEELLEGLENGYMTDYELQIRVLAEKYNVSIIPGASG